MKHKQKPQKEQQRKETRYEYAGMNEYDLAYRLLKLMVIAYFISAIFSHFGL